MVTVWKLLHFNRKCDRKPQPRSPGATRPDPARWGGAVLGLEECGSLVSEHGLGVTGQRRVERQKRDFMSQMRGGGLSVTTVTGAESQRCEE